MSHFVVLVVGDVNSQLEKYDENIEYPRYVKGELSEEDKQSFMEYYQKNYPRLGEATFDEMYAEFGECWNNNDWEKQDGVWMNTSTYNPHSQWDWYVVGGRWSNFLMLKSKTRFQELLDSLGLSMGEVETLSRLKNSNLAKFHATVDKYQGKSEQVKLLVSLANTIEENKVKYADSALKKDIDFEGMRKKSEEKALEYYDLVASCFKGNIIPKLDKTYLECVELCGGNDVEGREMYNSQPAMEELQQARENKDLNGKQVEAINGFYFDIDVMKQTREAYGKSAYNSAISTYAVVMNGEWYSKGKMGWWGMSSDDMTQDEWNAKITELLDSVNDNAEISIVDCHI